MRTQKLIFIGWFILVGMLLIGCNPSNPDNMIGLQIYSMTTGVGAADNNDIMDKQKLSYSITLTNEENRDIYVKSITPILGDGISNIVITEELTVIVEKSLPANQSLKINDELIIDTEGLSKEEILDLQPFITDIKISTEQIIELPGQQ